MGSGPSGFSDEWSVFVEKLGEGGVIAFHKFLETRRRIAYEI
jgi:hypothetical protein